MTMISQGLNVQPTSLDDVAEMVELERTRYGPDAWSESQIRDELGRVPGNRWYGSVRRAGQLLGYIGLYLAPPDADIQTVTVRDSAERIGVGSVLLSGAVGCARQERCARIFLEVNANNAPALGLYSKFGFSRIGLRKNYYEDGIDAVNMRLTLPPSHAEGIRNG
jgi:ribosomal-protein-alanine N-acetyltransferase